MNIELDPSKVSPQTHRFLGMYRPPLSFITMGTEHPKMAGVGCCPCGCLTYERKHCDGEYDFASESHMFGPDSSHGQQFWNADARQKIREHWLAGHFDVPQWALLESDGFNTREEHDAWKRFHLRVPTSPEIQRSQALLEQARIDAQRVVDRHFAAHPEAEYCDVPLTVDGVVKTKVRYYRTNYLPKEIQKACEKTQLPVLYTFRSACERLGMPAGGDCIEFIQGFAAQTARFAEAAANAKANAATSRHYLEKANAEVAQLKSALVTEVSSWAAKLENTERRARIAEQGLACAKEEAGMYLDQHYHVPGSYRMSRHSGELCADCGKLARQHPGGMCDVRLHAEDGR